MKKLLLTIILILGIGIAFAQTATYDDVINKKVKGKINTYISKSGEVFNVGDTITLGASVANVNYTTLFQNAITSTYPLQNRYSGSICRIKSMRSTAKVVPTRFTKPQGCGFAILSINLQVSIDLGEIQSELITSDQALTELKKCKDKLDLGLITQDEFNKKKEELSKYIK